MNRAGKNASRSSPKGLDFSEDPWKQVIKRRRRFSIEETRILEQEYEKNPSPNQDKIQQIADVISTPRKIVTTWFQNRRAKNKRRERDSRREALRIRIRRANANALSPQGSSRDDEDYDGDEDDIVYGNNYKFEPAEEEDEDYYAGSSGGSNQSIYYTTASHLNSSSQQQEITSFDNGFDLNLDANTLVKQSPNNTICQSQHDASLVSPPPPPPPPPLQPNNKCQNTHTFVSSPPPSNSYNQPCDTNLPQTTNQQYNINFYTNMNNFFQTPGTNQQQQQPFNFFHHPQQQQQQYQPEYPFNFNTNSGMNNRAVTTMPFFMMNNNFPPSPVNNNNEDSFNGLCINPAELFLNFYPQQQQRQRGQIQQQEEEQNE